MVKGNNNLFTKSVSAAVCFLSAIVIISCPTPINEKMFLKVKDEIAPQLTVTSPMDGDAYGAYTLVTGVASDLSNDGAEGSVSSLSFEILGITGNQSIPINKDGSFSTTLKTNGAGYSSDISIRLVAIDWNDNTTETILALRKADGSVADFTVTTGSKSAVISWTPVPGAASYTLVELRNGSKVEGITDSAYTWKGLRNGYKYSFRLTADVEGAEYLSSIVDAIPLAAATLAPWTRSIYRGIELEWADIPAASEYVVERSESKEGPFSVRTITAKNSFLDSGLGKEDEFYYRVYPVDLMNSLNLRKSNPIYGITGYFPPRGGVIYSPADTPDPARSIAVSGDYAFIADVNDGFQVIDLWAGN